MILILGLVSILLVIVSVKFLRLKMERNYLDQMACVEQTRAQIATELLYEAKAKHQNLSIEETMGLIESIRNEPNQMARTAIADRIIMGENMEAKRKIGF